MKRKITALLALAMVFSMLLASCGKTPGGGNGSSDKHIYSGEEINYSSYPGWIEIDDVRYSIGDTVDKFTENGWEPFPDSEGVTLYEETFLPDSGALVFMNFKKGDATITVVADAYYVEETTPGSKLMIEAIKTSAGVGWATDIGATSETPFEELSSYYPGGEYRDKEFDIKLDKNEKHPWASLLFDEIDGYVEVFAFFDLFAYTGYLIDS